MLERLDFVDSVPNEVLAMSQSPVEKARAKLRDDIDLQIKLVEDPDYRVVKTVRKRGGATEKIERKPRSWVSYNDGLAYITVRIANRVVSIGGSRGAVIRCHAEQVVETLHIIREWADTEEAEAVIAEAKEKSKRGPRSVRHDEVDTGFSDAD